MSPKDDTYDMLDSSPEKKGWGKIIGLIILLLVIAGGVSAYFLLNRRSSSDTANANAVAREGVATGQTTPAPKQSTTAPTNSSTAVTEGGAPSSGDNKQPAKSAANATTAPTAETTGAAELKEVVHFASNSTGVLPADAAKLKAFLSKVEGRQGAVNIGGHADSNGSDAHNQQLSKARAEQVAGQLRRGGLNERFKVNVRGYNSQQPVTDNGTEAGRAQNRRVELTFAAQK
ncbi:MAG: OmpA family protein [Pyrinomonadaceae bacterium]|nr:OmpA family protein [Pyrinomonadaceae bacterium]